MAFPNSRETTYAAGSQVKSADLNKIQDRIVGQEPIVVADMTFTADHTTETLTTGTHNRLAGDGPFRLTTTTTLPTGLATGTDYWLIVPSGTTLRLGSTLANALAGTPVAFSDNGTGVHTIVDTASTMRPFDLAVRRNMTVGGSLVVPGLIVQPGAVTVQVALQVDLAALMQALVTIAGGIRGTAARASAPGTGTHAVGEVVFNVDPIATGFIGWVCVTAGTPGTWKTWGVISA